MQFRKLVSCALILDSSVIKQAFFYSAILFSFGFVAPPSKAQTASEAAAFLTDFVKCNPPIDVFDKRPPNPQLSGLLAKTNAFVGNSETWSVVEKVTVKFRNVFNDVKFDNSYEYKSESAFKDLDPNIGISKDSVRGWTELRLQCRGGACFKSQKDYKDKDLGQRKKNTTHEIYDFCDEQTARRIANAISFLIKENGGTSAPF